MATYNFATLHWDPCAWQDWDGSPTQSTATAWWIASGKLVDHCNFAESLFCSTRSAFAVEICAQMTQIAGMAWLNSSGTLLLERLQLILSNELESTCLCFCSSKASWALRNDKVGHFYRQCVASRLMHDDAEDMSN